MALLKIITNNIRSDTIGVDQHQIIGGHLLYGVLLKTITNNIQSDVIGVDQH